MDIKRIRSDDLPNLDLSVKELINNGRWSLHHPHPASPQEQGVAYVVKGHANLYKLDTQGNVLSIEELASVTPFEDIIYFSDVRSPPSLSERPRRHLASAPSCCAHHPLDLS